MAATQEEAPTSQSEAERRVQKYMGDGEEVSYSLRVRETGIMSWIKSILGYGVIHWFVTNQRVIETTRFSGGFTFKDIPHDKISSVEYGRKLSLIPLGIGGILALFGLLSLPNTPGYGLLFLSAGLGLIGYIYRRQSQVLAVRAPGEAGMELTISKGQQADVFLKHVHAEREKHTK